MLDSLFIKSDDKAKTIRIIGELFVAFIILELISTIINILLGYTAIQDIRDLEVYQKNIYYRQSLMLMFSLIQYIILFVIVQGFPNTWTRRFGSTIIFILFFTIIGAHFLK